jgi:hypothetical protein
MRGMLTSRKALVYSPEAANVAGRNYFALVNCFGLNRDFLTISQCDESPFRLWLFADPNQYVSTKSHPCS